MREEAAVIQIQLGIKGANRLSSGRLERMYHKGIIEAKVSEIGRFVETMGLKPMTAEYEGMLRVFLTAHAKGNLTNGQMQILERAIAEHGSPFSTNEGAKIFNKYFKTNGIDMEFKTEKPQDAEVDLSDPILATAGIGAATPPAPIGIAGTPVLVVGDDNSIPSGLIMMGTGEFEGAIAAQDRVKSDFELFLARHNAHHGTITQESVTPDDVLGGLHPGLQLTTFKALHDTLMYANLLGQMVALIPRDGQFTIFDFGAGSSMPTLRALLKSPEHTGLRVVAVDVDQNAVAISKNNATVVGFDGRYSFVLEDMLSYLNKLSLSPQCIVVANPPYMPIPLDFKDPSFVPVDGGSDGTKYLMPILNKPMPSGNLIALRWCSLSNPSKMIEVIEQLYDVLYIDAHLAPFGTYARMTEAYLAEQRANGLATYVTDGDGVNKFTFIGCVLRRK